MHLKRDILLSIVIPFYNESDCVLSVCEELYNVLSANLRCQWEVIMINDGSDDDTDQQLNNFSEKHINFRVLHLTQNSGQSAAWEAGFYNSSGKFICTLDGDGQNDPNDIPYLLDEIETSHFDMICGIRINRKDSFIRSISSRLANALRSFVLNDHITDIGCSIRIFKQDCLQKVRLFKNAHRFFPVLMLMQGYKVSEKPVNHRTRVHGCSKYGAGINSRLWAGLFDLFGVYWLKKRSFNYICKEYINEKERSKSI